MKKYLFAAVFAFICTGLFAQQQEKPVVAVASFTAISGISETEANMITRVFYITLGNTREVTLVDRTVVDRVILEHNFQLGDWSNKEKTAELGKALNADWIVQGEMEQWNNTILITVQFHDINTMKYEGGTYIRLNTDEVYDNIDPLVNALIETIAANPVPEPPPAPPYNPAVSGYRIGDKGPGGGTVFFAQGGQYMEFSGNLGEANWREAKWIAENHRGGGFSNWHLPTRREIELIKGLLPSNYTYWTSDQSGSGLFNAWGYSSYGYAGDRFSGWDKGNSLRIIAVRSFSR